MRVKSPVWLEQDKPGTGWAGRTDRTAANTPDRLVGHMVGHQPVSTKHLRPTSPGKMNMRPGLMCKDFTGECDPRKGQRCKPG